MNTKTWSLALITLALLGGCTSEEDRQNAATRAEMETQQAAIIDAAGSDCGGMMRGLDAWYEEHRAEADASDAWYNTLSDSQKDDLMQDQPAHGAAFRSRITALIRCGGVSWFSER
ncbi:MAG: hypothetical protein H6719_29970 [Sandaracinaceae bacterium]|nr:hypothetical protein [Sandaracinaceae bacterium]